MHNNFILFPQMGLYLFSGLPLDNWLPSDPYLTIVRQWLLNSDLGSSTNQLAQLILGKINWGTTYAVSFVESVNIDC